MRATRRGVWGWKPERTGKVVALLVGLAVRGGVAALGATLPAGGEVWNVCGGAAPDGHAPSAGASVGAPLRADDARHVVVMEYEAWFGPGTGIAPQAAVTTCLQSRDMQALGGGYDSVLPAVVAQHIGWLEQTGVDAVTLDLTNNVSCIFDGDNPAIVAQTCPSARQRSENLRIRDNDGLLYAQWSALRTRLKLIPLLGGYDTYAVTPDQDDPLHRSALEKEIEYFGALMRRWPDLGVLYVGKPMMLIYLGTPVDPDRVSQIRAMLRNSGLDRRYTFRLIAGYLDSQPAFWADPNETPTGPIRIAPRDGFWSVVDRLNFWGAQPGPYFPTYNGIAGRVENMTASLATAGQSGWICTQGGGGSYCPDAALRYCGEGFQNGCQPEVYETLAEFMRYARVLRPNFLILDQFNEFATPDEGPTPNSNDDAEPTRQWGYSGLRALIGQIGMYRAAVGQ